MTTKVTDGFQRTQGALYVDGRDVAAIAADVRKDIAAAVKAGDLPAANYSVRISRYSMGRSITVRLHGLGRVYDRAAYAFDGLRVERRRDASGSHMPFLAPLVREALAKVEALAKAYQRTASDWASDYHDCNFHLSVDVDTGDDYERMCGELQAAHAAALKLCASRPANDVRAACVASTGWEEA